jgi:biofilm protein TabA
MIYDKIDNLKRYPLLSQISEFDFSLIKDGKNEIDGDLFFGIGLKYETKNAEECIWESHKKYLDVHVVLEGEEIVNISDFSSMEITKPYDEAGDYMLFYGVKEYSVCLKKGSFLVLYPNEVHQTAVMLNEFSNVRKIVFKVIL